MPCAMKAYNGNRNEISEKLSLRDIYVLKWNRLMETMAHRWQQTCPEENDPPPCFSTEHYDSLPLKIRFTVNDESDTEICNAIKQAVDEVFEEIEVQLEEKGGEFYNKSLENKKRVMFSGLRLMACSNMIWPGDPTEIVNGSYLVQMLCLFAPINKGGDPAVLFKRKDKGVLCSRCLNDFIDSYDEVVEGCISNRYQFLCVDKGLRVVPEKFLIEMFASFFVILSTF